MRNCAYSKATEHGNVFQNSADSSVKHKKKYIGKKRKKTRA